MSSTPDHKQNKGRVNINYLLAYLLTKKLDYGKSLAVHIPDGFLSLPVAATTASLAVTSIAVSCGKTSHSKTQVKANLSASTIGLVGTCIFAAQVVNFPVAMGTSGHLLGGAMAAILLGPFTAMLTLIGVLVLQCFVMHDGGYTALGANILNMAVVSVWSGWLTYHLLGGSKRPILATAVAAWVSVMVSTIFCSFELALSGTFTISRVLPAMLEAHTITALIEAAATAGIVRILLQQKAETNLVENRLSINHVFLAGLTIVLFLLVPLACPWPDGLESVLQSLSLR